MPSVILLIKTFIENEGEQIFEGKTKKSGRSGVTSHVIKTYHKEQQQEGDMPQVVGDMHQALVARRGYKP